MMPKRFTGLQEVAEYLNGHTDLDWTHEDNTIAAWRFRAANSLGKSTTVLIPFNPTDNQVKAAMKAIDTYFQLFGGPPRAKIEKLRPRQES